MAENLFAPTIAGGPVARKQPMLGPSLSQLQS